MKKKLRIVLTLIDDVSGTSIFNDGTKAFWSEGRSAHTQFIGPDGKRWHEDVNTTPVSGHMNLMLGDGCAYGAQREMTDIERLEHSVARNNWRV